MGQRLNLGGVHSDVGVEGVREASTKRLRSEPEVVPVAVEGAARPRA